MHCSCHSRGLALPTPENPQRKPTIMWYESLRLGLRKIGLLLSWNHRALKDQLSLLWEDLPLRKEKSFISLLAFKTPIMCANRKGGHHLLPWLCDLEPAQLHSPKQRCQSSTYSTPLVGQLSWAVRSWCRWRDFPLWVNGTLTALGTSMADAHRREGRYPSVRTWARAALGHSHSNTHSHLFCSPLTGCLLPFFSISQDQIPRAEEYNRL